MGKYWLNDVVLTSRDKDKTVYLCDTAHQIWLGESAAEAGRRWHLSGGRMDSIT